MTCDILTCPVSDSFAAGPPRLFAGAPVVTSPGARQAKGSAWPSGSRQDRPARHCCVVATIFTVSGHRPTAVVSTPLAVEAIVILPTEGTSAGGRHPIPDGSALTQFSCAVPARTATEDRIHL